MKSASGRHEVSPQGATWSQRFGMCDEWFCGERRLLRGVELLAKGGVVGEGWHCWRRAALLAKSGIVGEGGIEEGEMPSLRLCLLLPKRPSPTWLTSSRHSNLTACISKLQRALKSMSKCDGYSGSGGRGCEVRVLPALYKQCHLFRALIIQLPGYHWHVNHNVTA
ncbi:hypothetical protein B0H14DRAFT_2618568 [Mycena olivaceomarginata]|nr:hypothetical protein B0H14DRAFT_2618568 [Mycena olivaceomarginata]